MKYPEKLIKDQILQAAMSGANRANGFKYRKLRTINVTTTCTDPALERLILRMLGYDNPPKDE